MNRTIDPAERMIPFDVLGKPVERALRRAGLLTFEQLSAKSESEIASLQGIGPKAIRELRKVMAQHWMTFSGDCECDRQTP